MSNTYIVQAFVDAYLAQDQDTAAALLADDYMFTRPQDDHIDKDAFLQRCFPTAARLNWQRLLAIADIAPHDVFILYEYELTTGERYRNTEVSPVREGQLVETQVFFGGARQRVTNAHGRMPALNGRSVVTAPQGIATGRSG